VLLRWQFACLLASCPGCVFKRNPTKVLGPLLLKSEMEDSKITLLLDSLVRLLEILFELGVSLRTTIGKC
jgi:hypothetical protein